MQTNLTNVNPEKITSPARLAANQANALKSTGPQTEAGRTASKMNALKHGIFSSEILVRGEFGEMVEIECGEYTSIPEASADMPAALARLNAEYPASVDFHYPHDIKAGQWRVVPIEPIRPQSRVNSREPSL